jgi:putative ABC transport system permease protein
VLRSIASARGAQSTANGIDIGGYLSRGGHRFGVSVSVGNFTDPLAVPSAIVREHLRSGGIVLSEKAARDLGVGVGDPVLLQHPVREGSSFHFVGTTVPVRGVLTSPYRFVAYMDLADAGIFGLTGLVNAVKVAPAAGSTAEQVQRALSPVPGVASALTASSLSQTMRSTLALINRLFVILQTVIALLAFLVAYNSSNVGAEERRREHATMFAFGVTLPRVVAMSVVESMLLGTVGLLLGLGFGNAVLSYILAAVFPAAVPDFMVTESVEASSYFLTLAIGLIAVTLAPLLNARRLRRMNLPSTLRYVE